MRKKNLKISIIGVCGMGRVGKTILVKNLNNELLNIAASGYKLSFGLMVWVTVPKVQTKIINRIDVKVDDKKSIPNIANKLHQMLKQEMSFVLILDDAWQMRTYTETKVYTMNEDESWQLFVKKAEDDASLEHIQPFAKAIARECNGLPLAIAVIGASVRRKKRVELWNYSLESLGMSEPHNKYVKDKVYMVIKWSFDSLESQDIELAPEQRSKHVNKSLKKREGFLGERNT